ncbi:MAG: hypothetical protein LBU50_03930 [Cellulomonas sp.]|jgi:hypothetical protein|nr:hypothetical protein [Cellulomonas sp.]
MATALPVAGIGEELDVTVSIEVPIFFPDGKTLQARYPADERPRKIGSVTVGVRVRAEVVTVGDVEYVDSEADQ